MEQVNRSQAFLRKRKMLLVLPLLIIPFLTMGFWAMGGGNGNKEVKSSESVKGLNLNLPDANLKEDRTEDKLSFYNNADKDSMKLEEWMRSDPYYKRNIEATDLSPDLQDMVNESASRYNQNLKTTPFAGTKKNPEQEIMQKLAVLQEQLNQPDESIRPEKKSFKNNDVGNDQFIDEVDRLETMLGNLSSSENQDSELIKMEGMLEKILDIQHPERIKDKLKNQSIERKENIFVVNKQGYKYGISLLDTSGIQNQDSQNRFYGMENSESSQQGNAIEAVVHENAVLVNGGVVKLRLINDIFIDGVLIPKNNFIYGFVTINGERLEVNINSIRHQNSIFPVKLDLYDLDGLKGIYIPGAITREVAKESADNSLQMLELNALDPSLKAQATTAGINSVKSLLSKKVKLVKVTLKAGYKILLIGTNSR